jgi:hypothetical protein
MKYIYLSLKCILKLFVKPQNLEIVYEFDQTKLLKFACYGIPTLYFVDCPNGLYGWKNNSGPSFT